MPSTRLTTKGQIVIPKAVRDANYWEPGQRLVLEERPDGVLLRPSSPFQQTSLTEVVGCLKYAGPAKSVEEADAAIALGLQEPERDRR